MRGFGVTKNSGQTINQADYNSPGYISATSKFHTNLVLDKSGGVVGIYLEIEK